MKKKIILEYKISPKKVVRIYNGIETDYFRSDGKRNLPNDIQWEFNLKDNAKIIGAVGRLVPKKGVEYLIKAVPQILNSFPETIVLIVGDGPLKARLIGLSRELQVKDNVLFTGFRTDIKEILSAIDILLIPSLLEGFPMITLEAMAMAKPIVATRIEGISEQIVDRESGILVPHRDPEALAKAIIYLIHDNKFANTLGSQARMKVEKEFTVEKMVASTEKVYRSLL